MTSLIDRIAAVIWDHDQRGDYCLCGFYTGDKTHPNHVATILAEELGLDHYLPILPPQPGQKK